MGYGPARYATTPLDPWGVFEGCPVPRATVYPDMRPPVPWMIEYPNLFLVAVVLGIAGVIAAGLIFG